MTYRTAVIDLPNAWLVPVVIVAMLVILTYIAGRVHQFFKQTIEREQAFRDGYNTATRSLFALATRTAKGHYSPSPRPEPKMQPGYASVPHEGKSPLPARHRAAGRRKSNLADTRRFEDWPRQHNKAA